MSFAKFRLYYKIEFYSNGTIRIPISDMELERTIFPDFMNWYNDTFFESHFCLYRTDEIPPYLKVIKHYPTFDKDKGIAFVVEYEVKGGSGIEQKDYDQVIKKIKEVAEFSNDQMDVYSDCVCHSGIESDGKKYWPSIDTSYYKIVLDTHNEAVHIKYDNAEDIEHLEIMLFTYPMNEEETRLRKEKELNLKLIKSEEATIGKLKEEVTKFQMQIEASEDVEKAQKSLEASKKAIKQEENDVIYLKRRTGSIDYIFENKDKFFLK